MLWRNRRESGNVEDRRRLGAGSVGIGGLLVGAFFYYLMGGNPVEYIAQNSGQVQTQKAPTQESEDHKKFVSVVLADTEDVWHSLFKNMGKTYQEPKMVLFSNQVQSACGSASSAVGPFYCPGDQKVYLDLNFFRQLSQSLGANGDFAEAYVVAHEVGHHVQNLLGVERAFRANSQGMGEVERNRQSVTMELQADCLAGVWAKQTQDAKQVIEAGDVDEALNAASAVGDDRLQSRSRGEVMPDSFTHGSSAQRVQAFKVGFGQGDLNTCLSSYQIKNF